MSVEVSKIYENLNYTSGFKPKDIEGILYKNCNFFMADAARINIKNCEFENCNFKSANFDSATISLSNFINCDFASAAFKDSIIKQCEFNDCDFSFGGLRDAISISLCKFTRTCKGIRFSPGLEVIDSPDVGYLRVLLKKEAKPGPHPSSSYTMNAKALALKSAEMVEPHMLPEIPYYRSSPSKIEKSKKHPIYSEQDDTADEYEDAYSECGYEFAGWANHRPHGARTVSGYYRGGVYVNTYLDEKYQYGYMENAVLECSAIEEFEDIEKHVRPTSGRRRLVPLLQK